MKILFLNKGLSWPADRLQRPGWSRIYMVSIAHRKGPATFLQLAKGFSGYAVHPDFDILHRISPTEFCWLAYAAAVPIPPQVHPQAMLSVDHPVILDAAGCESMGNSTM